MKLLVTHIRCHTYIKAAICKKTNSRATYTNSETTKRSSLNLCQVFIAVTGSRLAVTAALRHSHVDGFKQYTQVRPLPLTQEVKSVIATEVQRKKFSHVDLLCHLKLTDISTADKTR